MQNLSDYIFFKTEKCQEPLCESYQGNVHSKKLPEKFADCENYHNDQDKKREPFINLTTLTLAYQPFRSGYAPDPENCLNEVEFLYHPVNYKAFPCNVCLGYYCPYFHTNQEKQKWDKLLERDTQDKVLLKGDQDKKYEETRNSKNNEGKRIGIRKDYEEKKEIKELDPFKYGARHNGNLLERIKVDDDSYENRQQFQEGSVLDQIDEDHRIAVDLQKEIDNCPSQVNNLRSLLEDAVEKIMKKDLDVTIQHKKQSQVLDLRENSHVVQNKSMASGMINKEEIGSDETLEMALNQSYATGKEPSYEKREYRRVYAITEADIQIRKNQVNNQEVKRDAFQKNSVPIFYGKKVYKYGEKVDITENRQNEFKCFRTNQFYEELLDKYVSGFLNSRGGTIYLGISDDGKAWGIKLDTRALTELVFIFDRKFKSYYPPVKPEQYLIELCYVYDAKNKQTLKDFFVLHIIISQGDLTELYFNDRELCYTRKQASTILLRPIGMKEELKARTKRQMARNLVSALGDTGFDECLKRQSREDLEEIRRLFEEKIKLIDLFLNENKAEYNQLLRDLGLGKSLPVDT